MQTWIILYRMNVWSIQEEEPEKLSYQFLETIYELGSLCATPAFLEEGAYIT